MYTITEDQGESLTYTLQGEAQQSCLAIVPDRGGIITQWQWRGREIFYLDQERFQHPELTVRGGIPILFPICGGLGDNTYTHNQQAYQLPQHGFARNLPWTVTNQLATEAEAAITLTLVSNDQTRLVYPFDFQLDFTYHLQGDQLSIASKIINQSPESLPFSLGFHPYFATIDKTKLEFQIPSSAYEDHKNHLTFAFEGNFDLDTAEIDVIFRQLQHGTIVVKDHAQGLQMSLQLFPEIISPYQTNSERFYRHLIFWTLQGKDFYCLEPRSAARNALNTHTDLTFLEPGATLTANWQIILKEIA